MTDVVIVVSDLAESDSEFFEVVALAVTPTVIAALVAVITTVAAVDLDLLSLRLRRLVPARKEEGDCWCC